MLLSRYNNIEFILSLELPQFIALIEKAMEKQHEEREFVLYSTIYPNMTQENHISFKEYYKGIPKRRDTRKAIEIVEDIINTYDETEWEVGM